MRPFRASCAARVVTVATAVLVASAVVTPVAGAQAEEWIPPVDGSVVRAFVAPIAEYAAGHRGIDFAAAPGATVRASNDGTVSFAGTVAGALHVVVAHEGGIRTSYSFLSSVDVRAGQQVGRGDVVGRAGGTGDGHGTGVLHFGVRIGDRYVDPMLLFRPRDLTQIVRLVPPEEIAAAALPDRSRDIAELERIVADEGGEHDCSGVVGDVAGAFGLGGAVESACDALEEAIDTGLRVVLAIVEGAQEAVDALARVANDVVDRMRRTGEAIQDAAVAVAGAVSDTVVAAIEAAVELAKDVYVELTTCPQPKAKKRIRGSGNVAFAVGGYDSQLRRRRDGTVEVGFDFQAGRLGYQPGEVEHFSYDLDDEYAKDVTHQDIYVSSARLAEQLRSYAREHPLQPIDLIAHSMGGVVVYAFLAFFYVGHEHLYPRVENVVTYDSPLEGTPLTNLQRAAGDLGLTDPSSPALRQLQEGSPFITRLQKAKYPTTTRYLSIAGSEDPVVPSTSADPPRGEKITVPVGDTFVPDDHSAVLRDDDALSAAQAHLSGGAPADTCGPLVDVPGAVETAVVRGATKLLDAANSLV